MFYTCTSGALHSLDAFCPSHVPLTIVEHGLQSTVLSCFNFCEETLITSTASFVDLLPTFHRLLSTLVSNKLQYRGFRYGEGDLSRMQISYFTCGAFGNYTFSMVSIVGIGNPKLIAQT